MRWYPRRSRITRSLSCQSDTSPEKMALPLSLADRVAGNFSHADLVYWLAATPTRRGTANATHRASSVITAEI